jgi:hypothetical protein
MGHRTALVGINSQPKVLEQLKFLEKIAALG